MKKLTDNAPPGIRGRLSVFFGAFFGYGRSGKIRGILFALLFLAAVVKFSSDGIWNLRHPPHPLPETGKVWKASAGEILLPFKLTAPKGTHVFAKLLDAKTGAEETTFFVRGGESAEVDVAPGVYRFRYASGKTWRGPEFLFGRKTEYRENPGTLEFRVDPDDPEQCFVPEIELCETTARGRDPAKIDGKGF